MVAKNRESSSGSRGSYWAVALIKMMMTRMRCLFSDSHRKTEIMSFNLFAPCKNRILYSV
jgi:hypothetical protein